MNIVVKQLNSMLGKFMRKCNTGVDEAHQYYEQNPKEKPQSDGKIVCKDGRYFWQPKERCETCGTMCPIDDRPGTACRQYTKQKENNNGR
jgi:hypothetical protein